jgi:hypothetical protein
MRFPIQKLHQHGRKEPYNPLKHKPDEMLFRGITAVYSANHNKKTLRGKSVRFFECFIPTFSILQNWKIFERKRSWPN